VPFRFKSKWAQFLALEELHTRIQFSCAEKSKFEGLGLSKAKKTPKWPFPVQKEAQLL
jgi:hypothetical protein